LAVKAFRVAGVMYFEDGRWQKFTKDVVAEDEDQAREKVLSILGSKHRLKPRCRALAAVCRERKARCLALTVCRYNRAWALWPGWAGQADRHGTHSPQAPQAPVGSDRSWHDERKEPVHRSDVECSWRVQ